MFIIKKALFNCAAGVIAVAAMLCGYGEAADYGINKEAQQCVSLLVAGITTSINTPSILISSGTTTGVINPTASVQAPLQTTTVNTKR